MKYKMFFANLPKNITEEQLREVCSAYGNVDYFRFDIDETTNEFTGRARVTMQSKEPLELVLTRLNAHQFEGQRIIVGMAHPKRDQIYLTQEQESVVNQIVETLNEDVKPAVRQIARIVKFCGIPFALHLLDDTLQIEAEGGVWLSNFKRHRTLGGLFLHLARTRISPQMQGAIFLNKQLKKGTSKKRSQQAAATKDSAQAPAAGASGTSQESVESTPLAPGNPPPAKQKAPEPKAVSPQEQLVQLRRAHQDAQDLLAAVKAGKASASPMVTMKAVIDTKRAIDDFLRQHPELA